MSDGTEFSGMHYTIDKGDNGRDEEGKVHSECYTKFKAARADKCLHCSHPCMKIDIGGRHFSGTFYTVQAGKYNQDTGGKVHEECWDGFRKAHADKCAHCGRAVIQATFDDGFCSSGSFYTVDAGKVHAECWPDFHPA